MPQPHFVEGDMTNGELQVAIMNLTELMIFKAHVVIHHFVSQAYQRVDPNLMLVLSLLEFTILAYEPSYISWYYGG